MQLGSVSRCMDNRKFARVYQLFYHLPIYENKSIQVKVPLLSFQNHFTNLISNILNSQLSSNPTSKVELFLKDHAIGSKITVRTLMNIFHITKEEAQNVVNKNLKFEIIPQNLIVQNHEMLLKYGFTKKTIQENISILSQSDFEYKVQLIQKYFKFDINNLASFLNNNIRSLENFIKTNQLAEKVIGDQVIVLSSYLQVYICINICYFNKNMQCTF